MFIEQSLPGIYQFRESCYSCSRGTPNAYLRLRRGRKGDNWSISFSPVVCYHPDRSHCYSEVVKSEEPYIIISGLLLHDPEVTKANKKFQKKRKHIATIREMQNYVETLKVLNATWEVFDATDEVDDGDVQINEETEDKETKNRSQS